MTVRFPADIADALDKLREEAGRTRSNMIKRVVELWFREHRPDLLEPPKG